MTRIAIAFGLGLACTLAACGGRDEAARQHATEVIVESAPQAGAPPGAAGDEDTEATVESAQGAEPPAQP
jgi:hypothetical protein